LVVAFPFVSAFTLHVVPFDVTFVAFTVVLRLCALRCHVAFVTFALVRFITFPLPTPVAFGYVAVTFVVVSVVRSRWLALKKRFGLRLPNVLPFVTVTFCAFPVATGLRLPLLFHGWFTFAFAVTALQQPDIVGYVYVVLVVG
jgi:hypothetical protein